VSPSASSAASAGSRPSPTASAASGTASQTASDETASQPEESVVPTSSEESTQPEPTVRSATLTRLTAFYAPKQASCVYVVDVSGLERDTVEMLRSLQGLLARYEAASIYLMGSDADRFWHNYAANEMGIYFQPITVERLLERFRDRITALMLYTPDTYEWEVAFDLAFAADAVIATEEVARRYGMTAYSRVTDLRGAYADRQAAYADVLFRLNGPVEYYYLAGESRAFADYAGAVHAPTFRLTGEAWETSFVASLTEREKDGTPAVVFTEEDASALRDAWSTAGFGLLTVGGFGNATFFSSASSTRRYTPKQPSGSAPAADGTVNVSFLLTSGSLGDTLDGDYRVWSGQSGSVPLAYAFPVSLCELAPLVVSWYNAASTGSNRLVAYGWCDINEKTVSYEVYRKWHTVNNEMLASCGLDLTLTDALREDTVYGENYGAFSTAAVIFVTDGSGDGSVWRSKNTPVIVTVNLRTLPALEAWLASVSPAARRPLYYAVMMDLSVYAEPYEILPADPGDEPTALTFAGVVRSAVEADGSAVRLMPVENLMEAGRR
ncbi:MAG: hypothetical protein J6X61_01835, partial [Clostridia bacterium]|nr:hypothetical protein [Clostridia bacterium]